MESISKRFDTGFTQSCPFVVESSACNFVCIFNLDGAVMKVGDLITLKKHCKDSGRLAIVISIPSWAKNYCYIAFMNDPTRTIQASLNNIIKLN